MPNIGSQENLICFGNFEVDLQSGRLFKKGVKIPLRDQSFQVLASLLERPGQVVTREDLRRRLWSDDVFVDFDNNLNTAIRRLRQALGDTAEQPSFIETLPKRGYCFIGNLSKAAQASESTSTRARIVVLPFVNLDRDPEQEYLSDAFTEELITELAALAPADLLVIARTTAMHYKHSELDVAQICSELRVDYLIEGGVRHEDGHVAVTLQLIRANDQMHLLSRRYESDSQTFFNLRTTMAEAVAKQIGVTPSADRADTRKKRKPTTDPIAYSLYLKGRLLDRTPNNITKAKAYYEEAISRDPNFALAYDGLAELYWYLSFAGVAPPKDVSTAGMFYATRALEIDSTLAETHALLAMYRKELDYDWAEVKREMDLALELDPASPLVRFRYAGSWLMALGYLEESATEIEKVLESDPMSTYYRSWFAVILWLNRRYDRAIEQGQMIVKFEPQDYTGYWLLGMIYREYGKFKEAIEAQRKAVEMSEGSPLLLGWLGLALGQAGQRKEAREVLDQLHEIAKTVYVPPTSFAWTYFGLGEIDEAFVWLDRAVEGRDHMMIPIKSYPFFDSIREDPRFEALLRKMNLNTSGPGMDYEAAFTRGKRLTAH